LVKRLALSNQHAKQYKHFNFYGLPPDVLHSDVAQTTMPIHVARRFARRFAKRLYPTKNIQFFNGTQILADLYRHCPERATSVSLGQRLRNQ